MESQNTTVPLPPKRHRSLLVTVFLVVFGLVFVIFAAFIISSFYKLATGQARLNYTNCTTAGELATDTIKILSSDFDIKEYVPSCADVWAFQENSSDDLRPSFDITLAGKSSFNSSSQVEAATIKKMIAAGWSYEKKNKTLIFKRGNFAYKGEIKVNSYQPSLAFIRVNQTSGNKAEPSNDPSFINNAYPEKYQRDTDKLRYLTYQVYTSGFVPAGYKVWQSKSVDYADYFDPSVFSSYELIGENEEGVQPDLRAEPLPPNYNPVEACRKNNLDNMPCLLFATTPSGMQLYIEPDKYNKITGQGDTIYAVKGETLLTLSSVTNHIYVYPKISNEDIVKIFEELEPVNTPAKY